MRDEQYYALANLVKRPMRRWWARVGTWWLVGLGLLLVVQAVQAHFEVQQIQAGRLGHSMYMSTWYQFVLGLCLATPAFCVGLYLQSSFNLAALIDQIGKETPAFSSSILRTHKYRLALLNSWPAMFPILAWSLLGNMRMEFGYGGPVSAWLLITGSLQYPLYVFVWLVWLVAIAIASTGTPWPAWALFTGGLLGNRLLGLFEGGTLYRVQLFPAYWLRELTDMQISVLKGIGLLVAYAMFLLYLQGRTKSANRVCIGLSIVLLLNGIHAGFGISFLDHLLQVGKYLGSCLQPLAMAYHPGYKATLEPSLIMWILGFRSEFPAGHAWAIVPVLNGIFWLFAHYFAFSWLMGRNWRARKSDS